MLDENDYRELKAIAEECALVGRDLGKKDAPKFALKDGISAFYQSLGIVAILIGVLAYVLTIRGDVNKNQDAIVLLRADVAAVRSALDANSERLRQQELKMSKLEK